MARPGDLVYCDPPYTHSQAILYGAQSFSLRKLFHSIRHCKDKIFFSVALDATEKDGKSLDNGTQDRLLLILHGAPNSMHIAEAYIKQIEDAKVFEKGSVTEVTPLKRFYTARAIISNSSSAIPIIPT